MREHGIVIGTFDSLAPCFARFGVVSVELNLAVIRARCGWDIPILVSDDGSPGPSQAAYRAVCAEYRAEFITASERSGHTSGDIMTFGRGLLWARQRNLKTLTKLSQRMILDIPDWIADDSETLLRSGFGTMTAAFINFGSFSRIRTEAVMMVVDRWTVSTVLDRYQPARYGWWNEGHTFETVRNWIDPHKPFPHFLPWPRLEPVRGADQPPVYFRQMPDADRRFRELAQRHGVAWPDQFVLVDSVQTVDYVS